MKIDREGLEAQIKKMELEQAHADAANDPERSAYYQGSIDTFRAVLGDLPVRFGMPDGKYWHNHLARKLQPAGTCSACDAYYGMTETGLPTPYCNDRCAGESCAHRSPSEGAVGWLDFEKETELSGDGSGSEETYYLTIADGLGTNSWPREIAVICHRTVDGKYPLDGELANQKRRNAQVICDALNTNGFAEKLWKEA